MLNDCYYFGSYTPNGFACIVRKNYCVDFKKISLCGYPDCVKQQLFRRIKSILADRKIPYTDLTDSDGSMGVFCEKLKFIVIDGELVNFEDAEVINLFEYLSEDDIKENEEYLQRICVERRRIEMRCERFLTVCKSISDEMRRIDSISIDVSKLNRFSSKLWKKYGGNPLGRVGTEKKRFVTSLTKDGVELNMGAFDRLCENIAVIYDKTGACSSVIVEKIRSYAISSGYDVVSCICPVNLEIEHVIIPQLKFGVFTSKYYHRADFKECEKIYAAKFHTFNSTEVIQRLEFSHKAYKSLMNEVFDCVAKLCEINKKTNFRLAKKTDTAGMLKDLSDRIFQ